MRESFTSDRRRSKFAPLRRSTRYDWLYLVIQVVLIAGVELADDMFHAFHPLSNAGSGLTNAIKVMHLEMAGGFWVEPGVQHFFTETHHLMGKAIGWAQVQPIVDALYGQAHVLVTLGFAMWIFFYHRSLFPFLRNVFLLTNVLAVALYEVFPLAPPRLARGLSWGGHPVHLLDPAFGGVKIGFNEFAAMPSLHVGWALIVGGTIVWVARPLALKLLGVVWPLLMLTTVVVTGNHYLSDALGAAVVVAIAVGASLMLAWRCSGAHSFTDVVHRLNRLRRVTPQLDEDAPEIMDRRSRAA